MRSIRRPRKATTWDITNSKDDLNVQIGSGSARFEPDYYPAVTCFTHFLSPLGNTPPAKQVVCDQTHTSNAPQSAIAKVAVPHTGNKGLAGAAGIL